MDSHYSFDPVDIFFYVADFANIKKGFGGTAVISNRIKGRLDTSIKGLCFVGKKASLTVRIFLRCEIEKGLKAV